MSVCVYIFLLSNHLTSFCALVEQFGHWVGGRTSIPNGCIGREAERRDRSEEDSGSVRLPSELEGTELGVFKSLPSVSLTSLFCSRSASWAVPDSEVLRRREDMSSAWLETVCSTPNLKNFANAVCECCLFPH